MTHYSRGYAAGLKAAAEVCRKTGDTFGKGDHQTGAYVCQQKISYLPIEGEAEGSGHCVVVQRLNEADRVKASRLIAVLYNNEVTTHIAVEAGAMLQHLLSLAAAKEEHDAHR